MRPDSRDGAQETALNSDHVALLDRYIARQFLLNAVVLFVIFCSFVVAIDVTFNLDRFIDSAAKTHEVFSGDAPLSPLRHAWLTVYVVFDFWWPNLVRLFGYLIGLVMIGALGFTCTQLTRHRELLAMLAAGQSLYRIGRPILAVALGFTAAQLALQEYVLPEIAPMLGRDQGDAGRRVASNAAIAMASDGQGVLLRAAAFDPDAGELQDLFVLRTDDRGMARQAIRAERAVWSDGGWNLEQGLAEPRGAATGAPVAVTRLETPLDPTRLRAKRDELFRQSLGFFQAGRLLQDRAALDDRDAAEIERVRWGRFSVAACNILALLVAMPFFVHRSPTGILGRTLRGAPVAMGALVGGVIGSSAEIPALPAAAGVFVPPAILIPVALAAVTSIRS